MRGRKRFAVLLFNFRILIIKKESPNEGTETGGILQYQQVLFRRIKKESPNEGTETTQRQLKDSRRYQ